MAVHTGSCGTNVNYVLDTDARTLVISGTGAMNDYHVQVGKRTPWYSYRSSFETVTIEEGVTYIGSSTFYECKGFTSITIPSTVTRIGVSAFQNAEGLETLILPEGVTTLDVGAFQYCTTLKTVSIPTTVNSIGAAAFMQCNSLELITFYGEVPTIGKGAFSTSATTPITVYTLGWGSDHIFTSDIRVETEFVYKVIKDTTVRVNVDEVWKESIPHVKVNGEWKEVAGVYVKVNGAWKPVKPRQVYTLIYDKSLASDPSACLTYAGTCANYTPMTGASGNVNEGSWVEDRGTLFDKIEVGYLDGTTWVKGDKEVMGGQASYNCFTRIPKIYEKVTDLGNNKVQLDISLKPFEGSRLHPAFIVDGVEKNHRYIGRYLGSNATTLKSVSGNVPTTSRTREVFRTAAGNNGVGYNLAKYWDWDLLNKLYLFAFKNFDSQTALGSGLTAGSSVVATGGTDGKSWMYGGGAGRQMSFLGIEDYYGNAWWFIDDFYCNGGTCYAGNVSTPTDDTNNKTVVATGLTTQGIPLTSMGTIDAFSLMGTAGGSATTGLCDQQYYDSDANGGRVGGYYASGTETGMFYINAMNSVSSTSENVGARLAYSD